MVASSSEFLREVRCPHFNIKYSNFKMLANKKKFFHWGKQTCLPPLCNSPIVLDVGPVQTFPDSGVLLPTFVEVCSSGLKTVFPQSPAGP